MPALNYSEELLSVSHEDRRVYPAEILVPDAIVWDPDRPKSAVVMAYTADELVRYLRTALQSRETKATIDSLLALSNSPQPKPEKSPGNGS